VSIGFMPGDQERRATTVAPLLAELRDRGLRWGDARAWGLAQIQAGTRPTWRPADMPKASPSPTVIEAYLDHLDAAGER
jgi:hypothetical protein